MFVKEVREHAWDNYETGGWDYVVECYSDAEIVVLYGDAKTAAEAIEMIGECVGLKAEYRAEIQATEW